MKCSDLKILLERAISFRSLGAGLRDDGWAREFFSILDATPNQSVKNLAKAIDGIAPLGSAGHPAINELCAFLGALGSLLSGQAKNSTIQEIGELLAALRPHSTSDIFALAEILAKPKKQTKAAKPKDAAPIRDEVVLKYSRRLEEALGDDEGFNSIFAALESDGGLSASELTAIAKKFANSAPKSRPAALKKIFARHQAIMVSRAKSAATAGRIAG